MGYFCKTNIYYIYLLLAFSLASCVSDKAVPIEYEPRMSDETLIAVLTDKHLAVTAARMSEIKKDSVLSVFLPELNHHVFQKHGVTEEELNETLNYYAHYPEQLMKIYDQIMERLDKLAPAQKVTTKKSTEVK